MPLIMSKQIQLHDLSFVPFLSEQEVQERVAQMGQALHATHGDKKPVFLIMLKGAFVFGADLVRYFDADAEVSFVRTQSYVGTSSTHEVKLVVAPDPTEVADRDIIIVEDIVDSGYTMNRFIPILEAQNPKSICLVSLLFKPDMLEKEVNIDHIGFTIPPKFVVGYGLDYNGLGRNLPDIYQLKED